MPRVHRVDPNGRGIRRVRRGRGFAYLNGHGELADPGALERIRELAIPPAWTGVWIAPDPLGHIHVTGDDFSAKDFRTWNATVLAASLLATHDPAEGKRAVSVVVGEVAAHLGNTPAVARASYVDPRIVDRFLDEGRTIAPPGRGRRATEEAVLALLDER
jgi:DNA topoisomerase IB